VLARFKKAGCFGASDALSYEKALLTLSSLLLPVDVKSAHAEEAVEAPKETVHVTVDSRYPETRVERLSGTASGVVGGRTAYVNFESYETVYIAPCKAKLDPNQRYRIDAPGMSTSRLFAVPRGTKSLNVEGGSSTIRGLGAVATFYFGLPAVLAGGLILALGVALKPVDEPSLVRWSGYRQWYDTWCWPCPYGCGYRDDRALRHGRKA
jgi:hypothetical protein